MSDADERQAWWAREKDIDWGYQSFSELAKTALWRRIEEIRKGYLTE